MFCFCDIFISTSHLLGSFFNDFIFLVWSTRRREERKRRTHFIFGGFSNKTIFVHFCKNCQHKLSSSSLFCWLHLKTMKTFEKNKDYSFCENRPVTTNTKPRLRFRLEKPKINQPNISLKLKWEDLENLSMSHRSFKIAMTFQSISFFFSSNIDRKQIERGLSLSLFLSHRVSSHSFLLEKQKQHEIILIKQISHQTNINPQKRKDHFLRRISSNFIMKKKKIREYFQL